MRRFAQPPHRARAGQRPVGWLLVMLVPAVVLAGCGSSPSQAPSASAAPSATAPSSPASASLSPAPSSPASSGPEVGLDACVLLPPALLSNILGGEVAFANPVSSGGWAAGQCAWNGPTSSFLVRVGTAASITAFGDPAAPDAKAMLAAFKQQASAAGTPTDVAEIGDGAVLSTGGMAAYLGDTYVEVTRLRLTDDQLVEIMRLAVANL